MTFQCSRAFWEDFCLVGRWLRHGIGVLFTSKVCLEHENICNHKKASPRTAADTWRKTVRRQPGSLMPMWDSWTHVISLSPLAYATE